MATFSTYEPKARFSEVMRTGELEGRGDIPAPDLPQNTQYLAVAISTMDTVTSVTFTFPRVPRA